MAFVDFVNLVHRQTPRDYVQRVVEHDKADCAEVACRFDRDYWDGDRRYGYGGYRYDGRWGVVAQAMVSHYQLPEDACILDVGCGKGFLLYEFTRLLPRARVTGMDISAYAVEHAKEEVKPYLVVGDAAELPYADKTFDFVVSINTLHNLYCDRLHAALREIERVGKAVRHVTIEAYRNEREKVNLMYWQLTCRAFHTPQEWEWIFAQAGYTGDYGYITFE